MGFVGNAAAFPFDPYPASVVSGPLKLEVILCLKLLMSQLFMVLSGLVF